MVWTSNMRRGAALTALGTVAMTLFTLGALWTWFGAETPLWTFTKIGVVIALVWSAIGATMGIFIVMIIKKNEGL